MARYYQLLCLDRAEGQRVRRWLEPGVAVPVAGRLAVELQVHRGGCTDCEGWEPVVVAHGAGGHYEAAVTCQHLLRAREGYVLFVPRALECRADGRPERVLVDFVAVDAALPFAQPMS